MWIVCQADDSHEISKLVFSEKKKKKNLDCHLLQILLGALSIKQAYSLLILKLTIVMAASQQSFCIIKQNKTKQQTHIW